MKTRGLIDIAELTTAEIDAMMEVAQDIVDNPAKYSIFAVPILTI